MLSSENIDLLRQIILDEAKASPTILGARLGDLVKKNFPGENIKTNYGSVAKFVNKYLASMLTLSGRHGVDNIYAFSPDVLNGNFDLRTAAEEVKITVDEGHPVAKNEKPHAKPQITSSEPVVSSLREAVIESVRIMTIEQLRQLPIPAGILLDAIRKADRF